MKLFPGVRGMVKMKRMRDGSVLFSYSDTLPAPGNLRNPYGVPASEVGLGVTPFRSRSRGLG